MASMDLLPGDIGFSTIGGRTGALVSIGQAIIGDACRYSHVWIALGGGVLLEAMPGGARVRPVPTIADGPVYRLPLTVAQAAAMPGRSLIGTPYSFLDYLALALHHVAPEARVTGRVRRYVTDSGHMICSQLVDYVLCRAGYHLFDDGRLPQDVTPGDLWYACVDQGVRVR
jgi:hypothetical protein